MFQKGDDSDMVFKEGQVAYIVESNRLIKEVSIVKRMGDFYIVRFANSGGGIRIRGSRLFATMDQAEKMLPNVREKEKRIISPYYYLH